MRASSGSPIILQVIGLNPVTNRLVPPTCRLATGITSFTQLQTQTTQALVNSDGDGLVDDTEIGFGLSTKLKILDTLFGELDEDDFLWSL